MPDFVTKKEIHDRWLRRKKYRVTPLTETRFKPRKGVQYCERTSSVVSGIRDNGIICVECHHRIYTPGLDYPETCPKCKGEMRRIGTIARLPRKNASKKKWEDFFKHCGKMCAGCCR